MPPVFGPVSPSTTRLWSCAEASGDARSSPSHEREEGGFLADEALLDHDLRAGRAEAAGEHHVDGGHAPPSTRLGDDDALAGGEPVGLHDDRRALLAHIGLRGRSAAVKRS